MCLWLSGGRASGAMGRICLRTLTFSSRTSSVSSEAGASIATSVSTCMRSTASWGGKPPWELRRGWSGGGGGRGHISWRDHLHQVVLHDVTDDAVPAKTRGRARREERSLHAITACEEEERGEELRCDDALVEVPSAALHADLLLEGDPHLQQAR